MPATSGNACDETSFYAVPVCDNMTFLRITITGLDHKFVERRHQLDDVTGCRRQEPGARGQCSVCVRMFLVRKRVAFKQSHQPTQAR